MARERDYAKEYERRIALGKQRGLSRSQSRGHAAKGETAISALPVEHKRLPARDYNRGIKLVPGGRTPVRYIHFDTLVNHLPLGQALAVAREIIAKENKGYRICRIFLECSYTTSANDFYGWVGSGNASPGSVTMALRRSLRFNHMKINFVDTVSVRFKEVLTGTKPAGLSAPSGRVIR